MFFAKYMKVEKFKATLKLQQINIYTSLSLLFGWKKCRVWYPDGTMDYLVS